MKNFLAPLAISLACAGQPAVKQTPMDGDREDDRPVQTETAQPQTDLSKPNEPRLSQSEAKIIVMLAQTNVKARKALKRAQQEIEEFTVLCKMEDRGFFVNERQCTRDKIRAAQAQFCERDKRLTASVSQLEKHQPFQSERTRLLLKNLKMTIDEMRRIREAFFRKHL